VPDSNVDFTAPALLKKWPSLNKQRISKAWGGVPYIIMDGSLDECIDEFMFKDSSQRHLYEIYTKPQLPLVTEVLQSDQITELSRLRDFL
jgi:hypothetical protein